MWVVHCTVNDAKKHPDTKKIPLSVHVRYLCFDVILVMTWLLLSSVLKTYQLIKKSVFLEGSWDLHHSWRLCRCRSSGTCCLCLPPCMETLGPGGSRSSLWSRKRRLGTLRSHGEDAGCLWGCFWGGGSLQATIWGGEEGRKRSKKSTRDTNIWVKLAKTETDPWFWYFFLWPVCSQLDPDDVSVFGFLSSPAVVAEPAPIRHRNVEAVGVKSCRTRLTAQQLPSCNTTTI